MPATRDLRRLLARFEELTHVVRWPEERLYLCIESVSAWCPAQHVDHSLRAIHAVFDTVAALRAGEDPSIRTDGVVNLAGFAVLTTGWIPRGRGEAPPAVLPEPRPVRQRLRETVGETQERTRRLLEDAQAADETPGTMAHPVLGALRAPQWLRFADVHTRHHLAIVADIDRRRAIGAPLALLGEDGEWSPGAEAP